MEKPVFDYIICGGGAAGLLLLNALSAASKSSPISSPESIIKATRDIGT